MGNQTPQQKATGAGADKLDTKQKQDELRGTQQKGNANTGQNQNPGKGAPARHLTPDDSENRDKREGQSDGEGVQNVENPREDAALIKEQIRSRDA